MKDTRGPEIRADTGAVSEFVALIGGRAREYVDPVVDPLRKEVKQSKDSNYDIKRLCSRNESG